MQSFSNRYPTVLFQDSKHVEKIVDVDGDVGDEKMKIDVDAKSKHVEKSESGKSDDSPSAEALKNNPLLAQVCFIPLKKRLTSN